MTQDPQKTTDARTRLEEARLGNVRLFQSGAEATSCEVAVNYFRAAEALFELREWHESAILAKLSLKGLSPRSDKPSRAEALLLLAQASHRYGDPDQARWAVNELAGDLDRKGLSERQWSEAEALTRVLASDHARSDLSDGAGQNPRLEA